MKEKTKEKSCIFGRLLAVSFAFLLFVCNCSVTWSALQNYFYGEEIINGEAVIETFSDQASEQIKEQAKEQTTEQKKQSAEQAIGQASRESNQKEKGAEEMEQQIDSSEVDYSEFRAGDWRLILVNKQHPIPDDYELKLGSISTPRGRMKCDRRIISDLNKMFEDAKEEGINLVVCSPYRPSSRQDYLFDKKVKKYIKQGNSYMDAYYLTAQAITIPGASEHEIGLALDIVSDKYSGLNEGFGASDAGIWLEKHCTEYGFVIRYPLGKESITGIEFEPWHFRYVGKKAAKVMKEQNLCLEEFTELIMENSPDK